LIAFDEYLPVIEAIADLVCCQGYDPDEHSLIRTELISRNFSLASIRAAEDWCDQAEATSSLIEVLSLFAKPSEGMRIDHPLERLFVSDHIWNIIVDCRNRGIFSLDMAERLLEGVRAMDTRDWDDVQLFEFIEEACSNPIVVGGIDTRLRKALKGNFSDYYS